MQANQVAASARTAADHGGAADYFKISNLSKSFGDVTVVKNLSLSIRKGEFVSLLGPSGCGKTTTLRIVAGFMGPDQGEVVLDGERIDRVPSHKRGAAMVFQNYALFPHMTAAENVGFGLRMQKVPKAEIQTRVEESLRLVRLDALGGRYPRELSGGQQQRVALARAIVLRPKLLLLDEPLSNLDAKLRKELRTEFIKIHQATGTTTIFVTHDLEEAFSISDRVAVMNAGRVEQYDAPAEIFKRPATSFVASFVGHTNFIRGRIEQAADGGAIRVGENTVFRVPRGLAVGSQASLAIPAHLIDVTTSPGGAENCIAARVETASYLGALVHYELEAGGLHFHVESPVRADQPVFAQGDQVYACWRAADFIQLPADQS